MALGCMSGLWNICMILRQLCNRFYKKVKVKFYKKVEVMLLKLTDITPETLDQVSWEWEENRIEQLVRDSVVRLGDDLREARAVQDNLELRAKIRAMKLFHQHDMDKKEIANLLGITVREVSKWLK
mgnify:CR=1 FL=1